MTRNARSNTTQRAEATTRNHGFTLIELLIIVAIISIIAAICVPNFLESQMRSKVAAALDEMHTLAGALEAYWIEQRAYPPNWVKMARVQPSRIGARAVVASRRIELGPDQWLCETSPSAVARMGPAAGTLRGDCPIVYNGAALIRLTTPVPYVIHLPEDRFLPRGGGAASFLYRSPTVAESSTTGPLAWSLQEMRPYGYFNFTEIELEGLPMAGFGRTVTYVLTSFGPDTQASFTDPTLSFPACYDPTNGTVSYGDLVLPGSQ